MVRDAGPEGRAPEETDQGLEASVVETAAHQREEPDQELDPAEKAERHPRGDTFAPTSSDMAAQTEPGLKAATMSATDVMPTPVWRASIRCQIT
jgi:hypothetical protein